MIHILNEELLNIMRKCLCIMLILRFVYIILDSENINNLNIYLGDTNAYIPS